MKSTNKFKKDVKVELLPCGLEGGILVMPGKKQEYLVTKCGKVWDKVDQVIRNANDNGYGYKTCAIRNLVPGRNASTYLHRIVATVWLDNPDNLPQVGHRDHDRANNHVDNLYWTTPSQNTRDGIRDGRINNAKKYKNQNKQLTVGQYIKIAELQVLGFGPTLIGKQLGIPRTTISSVFNGRSNKELYQEIVSTLNRRQ